MSDDQTIIIKKIKKSGGGHHGGAWKIAYADFVTAMMAFFLLLWLLNSVTQDQLQGIADHFAPISTSKSTSGSGQILGGKVVGEPGAMDVSSSRASVSVDLPPPKAGSGGEQSSDAPPPDAPPSDASKKQEQAQFDKAASELRQAIESVPSLRRLAKSLLIDNTPEGLRIQIVDQKGLAMFPSGSAKMYLHTRKVLELVAKVINTMPQKISISGHTDSVKFHTDNGYSNWELSADRANAARRELEKLGVPFERVAKVVGKAATEPLMPDDPKNARNRRLSIILLRGTGKKKAVPDGGGGGQDSQQQSVPELPPLPKEQPFKPDTSAQPASPVESGQPVPSMPVENNAPKH